MQDNKTSGFLIIYKRIEQQIGMDFTGVLGYSYREREDRYCDIAY